VRIIYKKRRKVLILLAMLCMLLGACAVRSSAATNVIATAKTVSGGKWVKSGSYKKYRYSNGKYATDVWVKISGRYYRFNVKGYMQTGWITYGGSKYYAASNGKVYVKKWLTKSGSKYYLQSTGVRATNKWVSLSGKYYFFDSNGKLVTGKMFTWNGKSYYVNKSGVRLNATWVKIGTKKYYFDKNGIRMENKWLKSGGKYYYLGSDGAMAVDSWVGDYYVGSDGTRKTNCIVDGYYLDATGKRTVEVFNGKYIFLGDSRMVGMQQSVADTENTEYIAKVGAGYSWLKSTGGVTLENYLKSNPDVTVVLALGVNDYGNISQYITYYKNLIKKYPKTTFYILSINPVDEVKESQHGYKVKNTALEEFNKKMLAAFGTKAYINSYDYLKTDGFDTSDGLHYTADTYKKLYTFIVDKIK
jgi:glucan-binding YG repeat protein